ncbi:MAG: methyltransferase domain-containing protein [Rhodanobacter sp.]|nr:MAG: methyltransferase domain-containing protein [Rhodanobacter sp.]
MAENGEASSCAREQAILDAWRDNAQPWLRAVRGQAIASRVRVTDHAMLAAVRAQHPCTVIDLGCGEGWLVRALAREGIDGLGVDAVAALVQAAEGEGHGRFLTLDYAAVAAGALTSRFDVVACNFSLLGGESVDAVLRAIPGLLMPGGALVVQTLHPLAGAGSSPGSAYCDGWREGSWDGCGEGFGPAAPWYFRTLSGWIACLVAAGLQLVQLMEPTDPHSRRPASMILVAKAA